MNITSPIEISSFLLQVNQQVIDRYDSLIGTISMIAAIFGVIIVIVLFFVTVRHIKVDKEIEKYKKEIQVEKQTASTITENLQTLFIQNKNWVETEKEKIGKEMKDVSDLPKEKLKKWEDLERRIDSLNEKIGFKEGVVSTSPVLPELITSAEFYGGTVPFSYSPTKTCEKCGVQYKIKFDSNASPYALQYNALTNQLSKCPVCHHENSESDYPLHTI